METDGQEVKKSGRRKGGRATINREVVQSVVHTFNTVVVVSSWAVRPKFGRSVGPLYFVSGAPSFYPMCLLVPISGAGRGRVCLKLKPTRVLARPRICAKETTARKKRTRKQTVMDDFDDADLFASETSLGRHNSLESQDSLDCYGSPKRKKRGAELLKEMAAENKRRRLRNEETLGASISTEELRNFNPDEKLPLDTLPISSDEEREGDGDSELSARRERPMTSTTNDITGISNAFRREIANGGMEDDTKRHAISLFRAYDADFPACLDAEDPALTHADWTIVGFKAKLAQLLKETPGADRVSESTCKAIFRIACHRNVDTSQHMLFMYSLLHAKPVSTSVHFRLTFNPRRVSSGTSTPFTFPVKPSLMEWTPTPMDFLQILSEYGVRLDLVKCATRVSRCDGLDVGGKEWDKVVGDFYRNEHEPKPQTPSAFNVCFLLGFLAECLRLNMLCCPVPEKPPLETELSSLGQLLVVVSLLLCDDSMYTIVQETEYTWKLLWDKCEAEETEHGKELVMQKLVEILTPRKLIGLSAMLQQFPFDHVGVEQFKHQIALSYLQKWFSQLEGDYVWMFQRPVGSKDAALTLPQIKGMISALKDLNPKDGSIYKQMGELFDLIVDVVAWRWAKQLSTTPALVEEFRGFVESFDNNYLFRLHSSRLNLDLQRLRVACVFCNAKYSVYLSNRQGHAMSDIVPMAGQVEL